MILGLTGGYCAGKNTVATLLQLRGWHCIDVDRLGHAALEESREAILARYGPGILNSDGDIDRRALGRIVFSDPAALADHEAIVHPAMFALLDRTMTAADLEYRRRGEEPLLCLNAAILYRMPQCARCDAVIEVLASLSVRLARAALRDGLDAGEAMKRIAGQESLWRLRPSPHPAAGRSTKALAADRPFLLFLDNSGSEAGLSAALDRCLSRILYQNANFPYNPDRSNR